MLAVRDKDAALKDSLPDLLAVLRENASKVPGFEKDVWERTVAPKSDRIVLTFELPGYALATRISVAFCNGLKIEKEFSSLPQRITLEVGPSLSEMISCGDMMMDGTPSVNNTKKNGSKTGTVQLYTTHLNESLGAVRNFRLSFVVSKSSESAAPLHLVLAKLSLKVN